jgi:hypothetical protein
MTFLWRFLWRFPKSWYPPNHIKSSQITHFGGIFHYHPAIFWYRNLWNAPIFGSGFSRDAKRSSKFGRPGVVVPSWQVMKIPDDMTFESAAALPTVVLTALHAVNLVAWPMNLRYLSIMLHLSSIIGYYRILWDIIGYY